ncbi:MAG: dihydroorotate dehydrogenase [Bdellovibrionales bacterium GWB1_55_8]|nr:MAG: dihydroorotate dehydrogenase [Bdellovibrionales bacterium GWB1_55_8]
MIDRLLQQLMELHPVSLAFLGTLFTWGMTALGASTIFLTGEKVNLKVLDWMLGFAAGVMIAASFWSLLSPAIEMSKGMTVPVWFPAFTGFLAGAICLRLIDRVLPHLHLGFSMDEAEGRKTGWRRSTLLVLAITLHNVPEGLAVGVAFGALAADPSNLPAALALALGIGIQNFPEGLAVAAPLRREGFTRFKAFWYGQLTGVVEIIAGVLGAGLVLLVQPILPYALAFAAGAMIFVVVEEVIPESQRGHHTDLATMGTIIGFALMMLLDVGLS